jgi:hypothetical protein
MTTNVRYIDDDVPPAIAFYVERLGSLSRPGGWNRFRLEAADLDQRWLLDELIQPARF